MVQGSDVIVVMGVAGSGKTTVGQGIAKSLGYTFADADDFHSAENRAKMSAGTPLSDEDRQPWLLSIRRYLEERARNGEGVVLACSALKRSYRQALTPQGPAEIRVVYLKASRELTLARLESRHHHFMKANMVDSQFATLEEPTEDEALVIDASKPLEEIVSIAVNLLRSGTL